MALPFKIDPQLDLVLEKMTDLMPEQIWKAWTDPQILMQWFCPRPWKVSECNLDLRPGGRFMTVMESPDGQKFPSTGCFLELEKNKKLVWTSALLPDYRPLSKIDGGAGMLFTAMVWLEPLDAGTKYTCIAMHKDSADKDAHAKMGFQEGWAIAFDQLVEVMKKPNYVDHP